MLTTASNEKLHFKLDGDAKNGSVPFVRQLRASLSAFVAFAVPFLLIYFYILNHFYNQGAFFLDSGWYADLMHEHWSLPNPKVILISETYPPKSFYSNHVSPFLSLIAVLSHELSLDRVQVFAVYNGTSHGLLALFMCRILTRWWFTSTLISMMLAALLAISYALNGLAINIASYPHFVMLIPALLLGTIYFLLDGRIISAAIAGILALLLREDVGFHLVAMLGVFIVFKRIEGIPLQSQRTLIIFLLLAFLYSCAAIFIQKQFASLSQFDYVYGSSAFGHVTPELVSRRLRQILDSRGYIWVPVALIGFGVFIFRNPYIAVGVVAFIPWMALQFLAVSDIPGTLQVLYAYPLMLIPAWLIIGLTLTAPLGMTDSITRTIYIALVLAASFVTNPQVPNFFRACFPSQIALHPQPIKDFIAALKESLPAFSHVRADAGIISLMPESFSPGAWLRPQDWASEPPANDVELLIYFRTGFEYPKAISQQQVMHDPRFFQLPNTNIILVTAGPHDLRLPVMRLLQPMPPTTR